MEQAIMVFTRVAADGFDGLINDPELVLALVEDMGFDQDDMLNTLSGNNADPSVLYELMQGRWSGEEVNFSFERSWEALLEAVNEEDREIFSLIKSGGRNSKIYNEDGPIMVLSPDQVSRLAEQVRGVELHAIEVTASEEAQVLSDLFPALQKFFQISSDAGSFVLVSHH